MAYDYIDSTGVIIPDTSEILADVVDEWRTALGQDLVVTNDQPQGVMIALEVEGRDSVARNNAALANQINPDINGGIFLDAVASLTKGSRRPETRSIAYGARLGGVIGSIIPAASRVSVGPGGIVFLTALASTIGDTGFAYVDLVSEDYGPIAALAGSINTIVDGALGWETVINLTPAQPGRLLESDASFRRRRRETLAAQGSGTPAAVQSRLAGIESVLSHTFRENVENFTQVIDGITLKPHSIWVCVDGGSDEEVAQALLNSKGGGSGWNGDVSVQALEATSGQTYSVQFDRPDVIAPLVRVAAKFSNLDGVSIIKNALMQYASGELDGDAGFVVGQSVYPFELAGAINIVEPRIVVALIELSSDGGTTWSSNFIPVGVGEVARLSRENITVISV